MTETKLNIRNLKDIPVRQAGKSILLYGPSGSGKTHFCGTAGSRVFYLDIGRSTSTLLSPGFKAKYPSYNPTICEITEKYEENSSFPEKATGLDDLTEAIQYALSKDIIDTWDTLIIDEATALKRFAMNKGLEINLFTSKSQSLKTMKEWDARIVAVQDYGMEQALIMSFVSQVIDTVCTRANKNFILVAHQRLTFAKPVGAKIGDEKVLIKTAPGFTGQTFPDDICGLFDWVLYTEVVGGGSDNTVYRVRTAGDERLYAKVRDGGVFSTVEIKPDFLQMLERVRIAQEKK